MAGKLGNVLESDAFLSISIAVIAMKLLADVVIFHETVQRCLVRETLCSVMHGFVSAVLAPFNERYLHHWQDSCVIMSVNGFTCTLYFMLTKK
jgi:hypothetical protein